jgi:hypothetical protein
MKLKLWLIGAALLVGATGCEVESGYGGAYGVYGEYPYTYYGGGAYYPEYEAPPVYLAPYDRDHYWDGHRWHERREHEHEWH